MLPGEDGYISLFWMDIVGIPVFKAQKGVHEDQAKQAKLSWLGVLYQADTAQ